MKKTAISRKPSPKQAEREAQRKQVVAELKAELGDKCEVCGWISLVFPIMGHEIVFRSKGVKSCKMDRNNIILLCNACHIDAHSGKLSKERLQYLVDKRNGIQKDS